MGLTRRTKEPRLAEPTSYTKLFREDYRGVQDLMKQGSKTEAEVIRQLVSEALRSRRLHAHGVDQTKKLVMLAQKKIVEEALAPIQEELMENRRRLELLDDRVAEGFDITLSQSRFAASALRFAAVEVLICRQLLRDYVYRVYRVLLEKAGKPVADLERNFNQRVETFRAEGEAALDRLPHAAAHAALGELSSRPGVFDDDGGTGAPDS